MLDDVFQRIAMLLPSNHAINLFKSYAYGQVVGYNPLWSVLILLIGAILSFGHAILLFNWDSNNKTRRGHPALAFIVLIPFIIGAIFLQ